MRNMTVMWTIIMETLKMIRKLTDGATPIMINEFGKIPSRVESTSIFSESQERRR